MAASKATAPAQNTQQIALDGAAAKFKEWMRLEAELNRVTAERDRVKAEFRSTLRTMGAGIGTFRGMPVLTETTTRTFRGAEFAKARPDLVEQYRTYKTVEALDLDALEREQPAVFADFLTRQLKPDWKAFTAALAADE